MLSKLTAPKDDADDDDDGDHICEIGAVLVLAGSVGGAQNELTPPLPLTLQSPRREYCMNPVKGLRRSKAGL